MVLSYKGFPGGSDGKEYACNVGDLGLIPGLGRSPGGGHGYPHQYSCLENPHGKRNLVGYSPWGRKELDTTEWLSTAQHWLTDLIYFFFSLENVFLKFFHSAIAFNSRIACIVFIHFNIDEQLGCLQLLVFPNKAPVSKPIQLPSWIHVRVISTFYTREWEILTNTSYFMIIKWFILHSAK